MAFSRQEDWSGRPFHPPRYLPDPGIKPESPALEADSLPRKPLILYGFPGSSAGKESPTVQETWVRSLDQEDPLEKEMVAHSSILAWRMPWTEEPGGLQSMESQRVGYN